MIESFFLYAERLSEKKIALTSKNRFAIVIENGSQRSSEDLILISARTGLFPLFIPLSYGDALRCARQMSRKLDATILIPNNLSDFMRAISNSAFTVCDGVSGAILSLLSRTPTYLDVEYRAARELIAMVATYTEGRAVLLPYEKTRMHKIKKVGVRDSDFIYVFDMMKRRIQTELQDSFNPLP